MTPAPRRSRLRAIAAIVGLAIVVAACTQPAGGGASSAPGGAATSSPGTPASAEPTKPGY